MSTKRISGHQLVLGRAYVSFASNKMIQAGKKSKRKKARSSSPSPGSEDYLHRAMNRRLNKYLKLICSLEDGEYLEAKLWCRTTDTPDRCISRLTKFKAALKSKFPEYSGIWKLRIKKKSGRKGKPYIHFILARRDGVDLRAVQLWGKAYWSKATGLSVNRFTVKKISNDSFYRFHSKYDAKNLLPFLSEMKMAKYSFGEHKRALLPLVKEKVFNLTESQMNDVRRILLNEMLNQADEFRDGDTNEEQIERLASYSAFCSFLTQDLREELEAVLAPVEDVPEAQKKLDAKIIDTITDAILSSEAMAVLGERFVGAQN